MSKASKLTIVPILVAVLAATTSQRSVEAVTLHDRLDDYALFAIEALRAKNLTAQSGDLGVNDGLFVSRGNLEAADSQLVANEVRLKPTSRCAALFANVPEGASADCTLAGGVPRPIISDVAAECGFPSPFPACDLAKTVVVNGSRITLEPGVYGDLVLERSGAPSTIELNGGSYVFCNLLIAKGGRVLFGAPSQVYVAGRLKLRSGSRLEPAPGATSPKEVRILVAGLRINVDRDARLSATLCAPEAKLLLRRGTIRGSAVARRISANAATVSVPYDEVREACTEHNPLRNLYFGDLHVHTALSFDAQAFDVRTTPAQAYQFAQGAPASLPPLDGSGQGTRTIALERALDFAAVTDHSEYLGEVEECTTPGSPNYNVPTCQIYRGEEYAAVGRFGTQLVFGPPRFMDVCQPNGQECLARATQVWQRIQDAAESAYDRTADCAFTTFVAYEYSSARGISTRHRNVIFRNERVPFPTSFFEQTTPQGLWNELKTTCLDTGRGCDALAIPHNSNESNGKMFRIEYVDARRIADERDQAELRAAMEPLVEIYQHKGDSECMNGISGVIGASDEQCDFEKDPRPFSDCGDGVGGGGVNRGGCFSRVDFVRGALLAGMKEDERLGINPLRLGIMASTDTHNGTSGAVDEASFIGHRGIDDDTPAKQLGTGVLTPGGIQFSPGGIVGVWSEENSRSSIFDALQRREVYGTSGPRIAVRLFGGWSLESGSCSDPDMVAAAYADGVPMGSLLDTPPAGATAPSFLVSALRDPGSVSRPGTQLQRIQIIKGWIDQGQSYQEVFDVAGDPTNGATVDLNTCATSGPGADSLCTVWTDPSFDPGQRAFYYARVLENPTCRWSTITCNALPPAERPPSCSDPTVKKTVQERAWTSPIWYRPGA